MPSRYDLTVQTWLALSLSLTGYITEAIVFYAFLEEALFPANTCYSYGFEVPGLRKI